jgi:hypothetical protein
MALQDTVRVLVPYARADELREQLLSLDDADVEAVTISAPDPATTYRGEEPDLELRRLVRRGGTRLIVGAIGGAVLGVVIALVLPFLNTWLPWSALILAFGGAWGGAVATTARGVQVDKREDDLPETHYEVDPIAAEEMRVMTVIVPRGRDEVVDLLEGEDLALLDSHDPKVGPREEPDTR